VFACDQPPGTSDGASGLAAREHDMEVLVIWIIMAVVVGIVASSKNRSFFLWFLYGFAIWPIALTHILVSKPEH
jgi:hypothetical protein